MPPPVSNLKQEWPVSARAEAAGAFAAPAATPARRGADGPCWLCLQCAPVPPLPDHRCKKCLILLVPGKRIELLTFGLQNRCSTAELTRLKAPP
jgi:hypothetical protein